MKAKNPLVILITTVVLLGLVTPVSFGQGSASISLGAMKETVELLPGESYSNSVEVTNEGSEPTKVTVSLQDFTFGNGGGLGLLESGSVGENSLAKFIEFSPAEFELQPGESKSINYSFSIPEGNRLPHWAALVVKQVQGVESEGEADVGMQVNVGHKFAYAIVQYSGITQQPEGKITELTAEASTDGENEGNVIDVRAIFKNTSETIVKYEGYLELRDSSGQSIEKYGLPHDRLILPEKETAFTHRFEGSEIKPGQYLLIAVIDYGGQQKVGGQKMVTVGEG